MTNSSAGRTRSVKAWNAILEATRVELAERGYDRLSIDRIATAAGVGKQTIYRWYPSKQALVAECLLRGYVLPLSLPLAQTGDCRQDISAWIDVFADESRKPLAAELIRAGTAAAAEDQDISDRYGAITAATESALIQRLESGIASGQLPSGMPVATIAETVVGALVYRILTRRELTPAFTRELLQVVFGE